METPEGIEYFPRMIPNPRPVILLVASLACTDWAQAFQDISALKATSDESSANSLFDINSSTFWESPVEGGSVSILLEEGITVESALVVAAEAPAFTLSGSTNYREWTLLTTSSATTDRKGIRNVSPVTAQYLRFDAAGGSSRQWSSVLAGPSEEIVEAANALGTISWGDLSKEANILAMAESAFEYMRNAPNNVGVDTDYQGIGWRHAPYYAGLFELWQYTRDDRYRNDILAISNHRNWTLLLRDDRVYHTGWSLPGEFFADDLAMGHVWLDLALNDPQARSFWSADVRDRIDYIMANASTIQVPDRPYLGMKGSDDWFWCDALFMAPPVFPRLAELTGDLTYNTFMVQRWKECAELLYDEESHLYYRDDRFFDSREENGAKVFWGRGNGWVLAGIARVLQYLRDDSPHRNYFETQLLEMAQVLKDSQAGDGHWGASILYPEGYGTESSATAFFTYGLAWGINAGILDRDTFGPVIEASWAGLANRLDSNGRLHWIQKTGAAPAQVTDKDNRRTEYAYGALFLAAVEMIHYHNALSYGKSPQTVLVQQQTPSATGVSTSNRSAEDWIPLSTFETLDNWNVSVGRTDGFAKVVEDFYDPANSYTLHVNNGSANRGQVRLDLSIPAIERGQVATLYQRFALENPEADLVFGISSGIEPVTESDLRAFLNFDPRLNRLMALSNTSIERITNDWLQTETWYQVWLVIDRISESYQVYLKGGSNFPFQTLVADRFSLRGTSAEGLSRFAIILDLEAPRNGGMLLDDLHIDTGGTNLSSPANIRIPTYSPWSHVPLELPSMVKKTQWGWLRDDDYPLVYHFAWNGWFQYDELDSREAVGRWVYAYALENWLYLNRNSGADMFAWSAQTQGWLFMPENTGGWYYDFITETWANFSG